MIGPIGASLLTNETAWIDAAPGVRRAVLVSRPELMLVAVRFEAGAVGTPHQHPHVQASYVAEGSFDVTIDGATSRLDRGASFIVAPDLVHGVVALEAALLIDAFAPCREDFL